MIQMFAQMHLLIAALLMAGGGIIAVIPSLIYLFYERWSDERTRRKAEEALQPQSSHQPKGVRI